MRTQYGWILTALAVAVPASAQHDGHQGQHSPYADQQSSGIAAVSRQEAQDLRDGAGMGLARAAELNHYPGPLHVLELSDELGLSGKQKDEIERFRSEMLSEAQRLGQKILEREEHLDRRFSHQHLDEPLLRELTAEIAELYGKLRFVHLRAHLQTRAILSEPQVAAYDRLRGYDE